MNWYERRLFIVSNTKRDAVKRRTNNGGDSKRCITFSYCLRNDVGEDVCVCKVFYLATLGYAKNNDTVLKDALNSVSTGSITPKGDGRGSGMHKKIDRTVLRAHIETFGPSISHYRREHAPNKRYLPSDVTVEFMHKDFISKHAGLVCSYEI